MGDGHYLFYSEGALRKAYEELQKTFAALGANLDDFPTIEEFRIPFEEELVLDPPEDGFLEEDDQDDQPLH